MIQFFCPQILGYKILQSKQTFVDPMPPFLGTTILCKIRSHLEPLACAHRFLFSVCMAQTPDGAQRGGKMQTALFYLIPMVLETSFIGTSLTRNLS